VFVRFCVHEIKKEKSIYGVGDLCGRGRLMWMRTAGAAGATYVAERELDFRRVASCKDSSPTKSACNCGHTDQLSHEWWYYPRF
jgi:hypothetical protein